MGAQTPGFYIGKVSGGLQEIELQSQGFIIGSVRRNRRTEHPDGIVEVQTPLFETFRYEVRTDGSTLTGPSKDMWSLASVEVWREGVATPFDLPVIDPETWEPPSYSESTILAEDWET